MLILASCAEFPLHSLFSIILGLIVVLIVIKIFRGSDSDEVIEYDEDFIQEIVEYRKTMTETLMNKLCIWICGNQDIPIKCGGTTSPNNETIIFFSAYSSRSDIYVNIDWGSQTIAVSFVVWSAEQGIISQKTKKFHIKDNIIPFEHICKFTDKMFYYLNKYPQFFDKSEEEVSEIKNEEDDE